ncbi:PaeR7I family type II restriction endonuclease [Actinacidiphila sp. ITFR-21]|uniref:PaeR7I family type II restriction endonuclease n=1 Tax=Actinacidiphila sp. ITFR-21 TaxID=3075199 RepID=UPI00288B16F3|nr:PaeR7I family type II restriction endonuclease [Streptomyces sp. ITFR-21]WNI16051.1 PaeR7I family type II restriction endonuclease [Streptomyces sp. ITFR-21]
MRSPSWDLVALRHGEPVLAVEYESVQGSEGGNRDNRADEVFGVAQDVRQAEAHGLLPRTVRRAYVFVVGITPESTTPVAVGGGGGRRRPGLRRRRVLRAVGDHV